LTGSNSVARLDSFPVLGGMQPQMALFRSYAQALYCLFGPYALPIPPEVDPDPPREE